MVKSIRILLLIVLAFGSITLQGSNIKTISTSDGLSNNVIFSMCQDHLGHIWIGTSDGLNIWNGHSLEIYDSKDGNNFFAGNTVREIYPDGETGLWVQTYYGVAYIDVNSRAIRYYEDFAHIQGMTCGSDGVPYIIDRDGLLYYFNKKSMEFVPTDFRLENEEYKRMHRYGNEQLYCFTSKCVYVLNANVDDKTSAVTLTQAGVIDSDIFFVSATPENNECYFLSKLSKDIKIFDMQTREIIPYSSLNNTRLAKEMIRAILPLNGGLYIGGSASGVYFTSADDGLMTTPIRNGIFVLMKDKRQNIIWIGTEGQGVKNWHMSEYDFEEILYDKLPVRVGMPIRSIFRDQKGKLWCGTKGDGIFTISGFAPYMDMAECNVRKITTNNSELVNNNVYAIVEGGKGTGIWIGTDGPGLNYYSYSENKLKRVPGSEALKRVHVIYEHDENTLWVSTHGLGAFRCDITGVRSGNPCVIKIEKIKFPHPFNKVGNIFSMYAQNDSLIWFGSRGSGAACLNTRSNHIHLCEFSTSKSKTYNDIYGMVATDKMHFATGCGLFVYDFAEDSYKIIDEIPQRAIHSVLEGEDGNIWLSTNYGIVRFDENNRRCTIYNQHSGLDILEYSDGASFKDEKTGDMFFGSNVGLTIIRKSPKYQIDRDVYTPEINIIGIVSNNVYSSLNNALVVPFDEVPQSVVFSVVDNINYADYEFFYRIIGFDDKWRNNGNSGIISLPAMKPGDYILEIYYQNKSNLYTSKVESLSIKILPPIYATWWAKTLYCLLATAVIAYYIRRFRLKYVSMKEELEQRRLHEQVDQEFLEKLHKVINENLSDPALSVSFLIDRMCMSRRALYRKLESVPDLKPQQLIKKARMQAAAEMLQSTIMTVEEIMFKVGYDNRSTFYTNFKETYGCTPKEYREKGKHTKTNK